MSSPPPLACVFGCAGPALAPAEAAFFREVRPWGFILFGRNVQNPDQVKALTAALREAVDDPAAPVLIDQEGGRVQRMGPPHWRRYPSARTLSALALNAYHRRDIVRLGARLMAHDLAQVGVTIDCAPVLDVPAPGAHDVIGDRAFAETAGEAAILARAVCDGLIAGGVLPVIKHIPGHGRAGVDSHERLPVVEASLDDLANSDFAAFRMLSDMPIAMTAHVVYPAIDADAPATTSRAVIASVIRRLIGFDGLLISDDLSMKALGGDFTGRAARSHAAGCDIVLHCNGDPGEMAAVAAGSNPLRGKAAARAAAALARVPATPEPLDLAAAVARFEGALAKAAAA